MTSEFSERLRRMSDAELASLQRAMSGETPSSGLSAIAGQIVVTSDGDVIDREEEMSERFSRRIEEGDALARELDRRAIKKHQRWLESPEGVAVAEAHQAALRNDAWAAHQAYSHLGIDPVACSIRWWGDPSRDGFIDVHIPGRYAVRVLGDGTCSGGEIRGGRN